jgi:hypothetical protein
MDTLETAHWSGIGLSRQKTEDSLIRCPNPYTVTDFQANFDWAVALTLAGTSLNRAMGLPDIYPFVIVEKVRLKLGFIDRIVRSDILTIQDNYSTDQENSKGSH